MYKETFTQIQPKNAKMPTLGPAARWPLAAGSFISFLCFARSLFLRGCLIDKVKSFEAPQDSGEWDTKEKNSLKRSRELIWSRQKMSFGFTLIMQASQIKVNRNT